jgi:hypothetical protein
MSILDRFLKSDPKERDPKYKQLIDQAKIEADEIITKECPEATLGRCRAVWAEQKRILKEKHNVDWKTPQEMNKYARFD